MSVSFTDRNDPRPADGGCRDRSKLGDPDQVYARKHRGVLNNVLEQPDTTPATSPQTPPSDEALMGQYRQGDSAAFSQLVERYQRELFHFLVRFLGDRAAAEDVFQETFLQVHLSAEAFDLDRRFRPWLFTIAANKARDLRRSRARCPTNPLNALVSPGEDESGQFVDLMESASAAPWESIEQEELQQRVMTTVMAMPENLREILLLSYFHQFPYKQISGILGIPLGTVKSRIHTAVAFFADRWNTLNRTRSAS